MTRPPRPSGRHPARRPSTPPGGGTPRGASERRGTRTFRWVPHPPTWSGRRATSPSRTLGEYTLTVLRPSQVAAYLLAPPGDGSRSVYKWNTLTFPGSCRATGPRCLSGRPSQCPAVPSGRQSVAPSRFLRLRATGHRVHWELPRGAPWAASGRRHHRAHTGGLTLHPVAH